jgi:hypothetical protein
MPSEHAVRCDQAMVSAMAVRVIADPESCLATTKVLSGSQRSSTKVTVAVARCTPAHRIVRPRNSDVTFGLACISGVMGQKSSASRPMSGRPPRREARNTPAVTTVPRIGCAKYMNVLPLPMATAVRMLMPMALSTRICGTGSCRTHRRATQP